jgi:hypothetical protein
MMSVLGARKVISTRSLLVHSTFTQLPSHGRLVISHEPRLERQPTTRAWNRSINSKVSFRGPADRITIWRRKSSQGQPPQRRIKGNKKGHMAGTIRTGLVG